MPCTFLALSTVERFLTDAPFSFRCAYIDVSEALRLHKAEKSKACCGGEHIHDDDHVSRMLYRKSMALSCLGFFSAARVALQICKRTSTDVSFGLQIEIAAETLEGKVQYFVVLCFSRLFCSPPPRRKAFTFKKMRKWYLL